MITPAVDVYRTDSGLQLTFDVPGVAADALDLTVDDGQLVLQARDHRRRPVRRAFRLPDGLDDRQVDAHLDRGVLTVRLPFAPTPEPRRVAVRTA